MPGPTGPESMPRMDWDGGLRLVLEAEPVEGMGSVTPEEMALACAILKKRLEVMEMPYASAEVSGSSEIRVEIPGAAGGDEVRDLLAARGFIEFVDAGETPPQAGEYVRTELRGPYHAELLSADAGPPYPVVLSGDDLRRDGVTVMVDTVSSLDIQMDLTDEGKARLSDFTSANVGRNMALLADKRVLSSVRIIEAIRGGKVGIAGLGEADVRRILAYGKSGALPVYLRLVSEEVVRPR